MDGIPTLLVLDGRTGAVVSDDGREGVTERPDAFPWRPKTLQELLTGGALVRGDAPVADAAAALAGKVVGLYFGASWCGPCKQFVPVLKATHAACAAAGKAFEVVYVPLDRSAESFASYYATMPWLAIPFAAASERCIPLAQRLQVSGIPHLVLLDGDSLRIINKDARADMDGTAKNYPWNPKAIRKLGPSTASSVNECPTLFVFGPPGAEARVHEALLPTALKVQAAADGGDMPLTFLFADNAAPITSMIRSFLGMSGGAHDGCDHDHGHDHDHEHGHDDHDHAHDHSHDHAHDHSHDHAHGDDAHDHGHACADDAGHSHDAGHAHEHRHAPVDETIQVVLVDIQGQRKFLLGDDLLAVPGHVASFLAGSLAGAEPIRSPELMDEEDEGDNDDDELKEHSRITEAVKENLCSFTVTKNSHALQRWYSCATCGLQDDMGCCHACANVCHAGHKLEPRGVVRGYCDCGAGAKGACKALQKK